MKIADLSTEPVWFTGSVPMTRNRPAVIVDLGTAWGLRNTDTWSRNAEALRPHEKGNQRFIPTVAWDGVISDPEVVEARLREAAAIAAPLLVDFAPIHEIQQAVRDGVGEIVLESGARGFAVFRMLRSQAFESTWAAQRAAEERARARQAERAEREAAAQARQDAAREAVTATVTAALPAKRLHASYGPVDLERQSGGPRMAWTDLAAIVEQARREGFERGKDHGWAQAEDRAPLDQSVSP